MNKIEKTFNKTKNVLFADPKQLLKREIHLVNQPFYFSGTNGKAVLMIHGWTTTPYELRRLGKFLNENGYTAYGPMLTGHGTVPKDLENIKWSQWLIDVKAAYKKLKTEHPRVYVVGTSLGSNLAIMLASEYRDISALVLMATPYKIKFESIAVFLAKINRIFKEYNKKFYPPMPGALTTLTRAIAYDSYPTDSVLETFKLIKNSRRRLAKITQPVLLMQSTSDHVASRRSPELIYKKIKSKVKIKKYIKRAYHTFISDVKNKKVFEEILQFLNKN